MKARDAFVAGQTVAQTFDRSVDAETAAKRLRGAGFSDVRLSEAAGRTSEAHIDAAAGTTEMDFAALLEQAGFPVDTAREVTRAVAAGAVLLTVAAADRVADAAAVLRGETVVARPLGPVDHMPEKSRFVAEFQAPDEGVARPVVSGLEGRPSQASIGAPLETGDRVVSLHAERLDIDTERTTGEARIRKEIVTEKKTITVPVQREELVVERDGEPTVRIPLSESDR